MAKGTLKIRIAGDDSSLQRALDSASKGVGKFGGIAKGAALGGVALLAAGMAGIGAAAFKSAVDLDKAYDTIIVGTGASGEALKGLKADFDAVFTRVASSSEEVGIAIADLNTRLGLTGEPLQKMAENVLNLTRITEGEIGPVIAATTRLFGDWSVASENQALALDKVFVTSQATGIGITALAEGVVQYGAPLRQLGFSFEEALAMMGKFEKEGVNIEAVFGGLRMGLGRIARTGEDPVSTFRRVVEEIKNAGSTAEANTLAFKVFGARAGTDMAAAIREGRFELDDLVGTILKSDGAIRAATDATEDFQEKWAKLKNRFTLALKPLGEQMMGTLSRLADWVEGNMPWIERKVAEATVAIVQAFADVKTWWDDNGDELRKKAEELGTSIVTAFGDVRDWWNENGDDVKRKMGDFAGKLADIATKAIGVQTSIVNNWGKIGPVIDAVWKTIKLPLYFMWWWFDKTWKAAELLKTTLTTPWNAWEAPQYGEGGTGFGGIANGYSPGGGSGPGFRTLPSGTPRMATGGTVTSAGVVEVGERGPELLNLPRGASVIPLNRGGAGMTVHIHVQGSVITEGDLERRMVNALRRVRATSGAVA